MPRCWSILFRCNAHSNTPAALAEYLGLTKGTTSQSIQVLERKGYIAKGHDTEDGRVVRLSLSKTGLQLLTDLQPSDVFVQAEQAVSSKAFASLAKLYWPRWWPYKKPTMPEALAFAIPVLILSRLKTITSVQQPRCL